MKIIFHKYSGAGNDFILINKEENPPFDLTPPVIKKLCTRRLNIGADGILLLSKSENYDFQVTYFNADGSTGSLCGNGARCSIHFAITNGIANKNEVKFLSSGKIYTGKLLSPNEVEFNLNPPEKIQTEITIDFEGKKIKGHYADTGSPHLILFVDEIKKGLNLTADFFSEDFPVKQLGKKFRYHEHFAPEGTNVNFVKISGDKLFLRTYERGVEDETLACGTGSVAAAVISFLQRGIKLPVTVIPKSGKKLLVDFDFDNSHFSNVKLIGPAEETFGGYFYLTEEQNG